MLNQAVVHPDLTLDKKKGDEIVSQAESMGITEKEVTSKLNQK